ncbi:MAG: hypothetical protein M3280_03445 [Actinomycetota bacterium]|nr:hypothetical protein [Actinomycetota bacterium]
MTESGKGAGRSIDVEINGVKGTLRPYDPPSDGIVIDWTTDEAFCNKTELGLTDPQINTKALTEQIIRIAESLE